MLEIAGGLWSGSLAILADGWHDLGDALSLALAYFLERKASKGPSRAFTYGYRRYSLLSSVIVALLLVAGSALILREAIPRFANPGQPRTEFMLVFAVLGILVNGYAVLKMRVGRSANEKVLSWHLLEDLLGWIAVLVGTLLMRAFGWNWIDPALAVVIALLVLWHVVGHTRESVQLFLQRTPEGFDLDGFRREVRAIAGVTGLHDLHAWSLDGQRHVLSLHVVLRRGTDAAAAKATIRESAKSHGEFHVTIETEFEGEDCDDRCADPTPGSKANE